jgi:GDPmannose 4,6-dehydratase
LSVRVDWGYAPDYVDAMVRILQLPRADDFVIATGEAHSVQDLVSIAFEAVGLNWKDHVEEDASLMVKAKTRHVGSFEKLRRLTGWQPSTTFEEMVRILVQAEEEKLRQGGAKEG